MTLAEIISTRGLSYGSHDDQDGPCCAVEAQAIARGLPITDDARKLGVLDVTPMNDSLAWKDAAHRTAHLGPVLLAIDDWQEWPVARQVRFARLVVAGTVERVLPIAHQLTRSLAVMEDASISRTSAHGDLDAVAWAAWAAAATMAEWADMGAASATQAARTADAWAAAAYAARAAAVVESAEAIETACDVWLRAADESK